MRSLVRLALLVLYLVLFVAAAEEEADCKPTVTRTRPPGQQAYSPRVLACIQFRAKANYGATERT